MNRTPTRAHGDRFSRLITSARSNAKAKTSNQKPEAGETRAKVFPVGVRKLAATPMSSARAASATMLASSRNASGVLSRATMPQAIRIANSSGPSVGGNASMMERASPGTMRLARNVANGAANTA